jgi:hypothetical protein
VNDLNRPIKILPPPILDDIEILSWVYRDIILSL